MAAVASGPAMPPVPLSSPGTPGDQTSGYSLQEIAPDNQTAAEET
jgi:hypothetical protein